LTKRDKTAEPTPGEAEAETIGPKRPLVRHPLASLAGLIAEATRVYRQARDKKLDHTEARSLVWMLGQMRAMVETQALERLEQRLEELAPSIESRSHDYTGADRTPRSTH
jgi:hypothetical protein